MSTTGRKPARKAARKKTQATRRTPKPPSANAVGLDLPHLSDAQERVLNAIAYLQDIKDCWRSPSNIEVARTCGITPQAVSQHKASLKRAECIVEVHSGVWTYKLSEEAEEVVRRTKHLYRFDS